MTVAESQDVFVPALCVWREMRGESELARLGCYWVIHNRATDFRNRWPKTPYDVVTQAHQFSSFSQGDPNAILLPLVKNAVDWVAWRDICEMCDNPGPDPTMGANMYEALPESAPKPGWVEQAEMRVQIGSTRFYRL